MSTLIRWGAGMLLAAGMGCALAQTTEIRASGVIPLEDKPATRASAPGANGEGDRTRALAVARQSAWKQYVAGLNPARQQALFKNEAVMLQHLDDFIVETVVLDQARDAEAHSIKVVARFSFNDERVAQTLQGLSVEPVAAGGQRNAFAFLFLARRAASVTQFEARRTSQSVNESASSRAADGGIIESSSATTGGSTVRKQDVVAYEVTSAQDLDAAVNEGIGTAGIEAVGYDDVVANCNGPAPSRFRDEFAKADEMSPQTRAQVLGAVKSCEVRYFAFGTVDSGVVSVDPVSGLKQVTVSVRAQTWDLGQKLPRTVGSVAAKQYSGLGPDQSTANRNAINAAARDVSRNLVDQLNARGIR